MGTDRLYLENMLFLLIMETRCQYGIIINYLWFKLPEYADLPVHQDSQAWALCQNRDIFNIALQTSDFTISMEYF